MGLPVNLGQEGKTQEGDKCRRAELRHLGVPTRNPEEAKELSSVLHDPVQSPEVWVQEQSKKPEPGGAAGHTLEEVIGLGYQSPTTPYPPGLSLICG